MNSVNFADCGRESGLESDSFSQRGREKKDLFYAITVFHGHSNNLKFDRMISRRYVQSGRVSTQKC